MKPHNENSSRHDIARTLRERSRFVSLAHAIALLLIVAASLEAIHPNITVAAEPPRPPTNVRVEEVPYRDGTTIKVSWDLSPDDTNGDESRVDAYRLLIVGKPKPSGNPFQSLGRFVPAWLWSRRGTSNISYMDVWAPSQATSVVPAIHYDWYSSDPNMAYTLTIVALGKDKSESAKSNEVGFLTFRTRPERRFFDHPWFALVVVLVCGTVIVCTELARRGKPFYVRPIAGLQAIEEAVGRATEMGKPMLFVPGIQDMNEIDTVAGLTILASVAKTAAEYDTPLEVPTTRALVMTAAREAVQAAALAAGRPDYYNEERIYYVTDEQFGYVASVCGWMYREKPAACFFLGKFYAESLILAETGNAVGAIQIAGTAETTQLPFFVAACDYTLLGEELFAASAYLSGEPSQLGMLKGQDFGKLAAMVLVVVGCLIATWDAVSPRGADDDGKALPPRIQWITDTVLKGG